MSIPPHKGRLEVETSDDFSEVSIFNSDMKLVSSGTHVVFIDLEPGIYRVNARIPGKCEDRLVAVHPRCTSTVNIKFPTEQEHFFRDLSHIDEAMKLTRDAHYVIGSKARLVLVIAGTPSGQPEMILRRREGQKWNISEYFKKCKRSGWLVVCLELPPGTYWIEHEVPRLGRRAQTVFAEADWETQILMQCNESPDLASAIIYMKKLQEPLLETEKLACIFSKTHAVLNGFFRQTIVLNEKELNEITSGKLDEPILCLLVAYWLLNSRNSKAGVNVLRSVLDHLKNLIPSSPDLKLLEIVCDRENEVHLHRHGAAEEFLDPPLFNWGCEQLLALSSVESLILGSKWLTHIVLSLTAGSIWARWEPDNSESELTYLVQEVKDQIDVDIKTLQKFVGTFSQTSRIPLLNEDEISDSVLGFNTVKSSLSARLARALVLPMSFVSDTIESMGAKSMSVHASLPKQFDAIGRTLVNEYQSGGFNEELSKSTSVFLDKWVSFADKPGPVFDTLCAYSMPQEGSMSQVLDLLGT